MSFLANPIVQWLSNFFFTKTHNNIIYIRNIIYIMPNIPMYLSTHVITSISLLIKITV